MPPVQNSTVSRDWLRAMQYTADATRNQTGIFARVLDDLADRHGDRIAILGETGTLTFHDLSKQANRFARLALANGIGKNDCVALLMPNCADYLAAWAGISGIGATVALINSGLRGQSLAHSLSITTPKLAIVSAGLLSAFESACPVPDAAPKLWVTGAADGRPSANDAALAALDGSPVDVASDPVTLADRALYIFTSGTTGLPKAANVSHGRIIEWSYWFAGLMNTTPDDRLYDCLPMYHSVGGIVAPGSVLVNGGSVVLRDRFSARRFWSDIVGNQCTLFQYIGDLCRYLAASPSDPLETSHRIRICCGNGLRGDVWETFQSRFKIPRILEFYAATEGSFSLYNVEGKPGAIGRLTGMMARRPPVEIVRFDHDSAMPVRDRSGLCIRCDDGEIGEAVGRLTESASGHRFEGYSSDADSERKILRDVLAPGDRWFRTGDLMSRDQAGFFYFADRVGDTFRWKGENVSTLEVSNALATCPGVVNSTTYGVEVAGADGRAGMSAIQVDDRFEASALYRVVSDMLPAYARPLFIRIVAALDTTETFKPRKQQLISEGYNPDLVRDRLLVLDHELQAYVPLTIERYDQMAGKGKPARAPNNLPAA